MSSHRADTRNQCHAGLIRPEPQVKMKFMFDRIQLYHDTKENKDVFKATRLSRKVLEKETKSENVLLYYGTENKLVLFLINISSI